MIIDMVPGDAKTPIMKSYGTDLNIFRLST